MKNSSFILILLLISSILEAETYYSQSDGPIDSLNLWNSMLNGTGQSPVTLNSQDDTFHIFHNLHTRGNWSPGSGVVIILDGNSSISAYHTIDLPPSATFLMDSLSSFYLLNSNDNIFDGYCDFHPYSSLYIQSRPASTLPNLTYGKLIIDYSEAGHLRTNISSGDTFSCFQLIINQTGNTGDEFRIASGSIDSTVLHLKSHFIISGGRFDYFSTTNTGFHQILIEGSLILDSASLDNSGSGTLQVILKSPSGLDSLYFSHLSTYGNALNDIDWEIDSQAYYRLASDMEIGTGRSFILSGTLDIGNYALNGNGKLILTPNGNLITRHNKGLSNQNIKLKGGLQPGLGTLTFSSQNTQMSGDLFENDSLNCLIKVFDSDTFVLTEKWRCNQYFRLQIGSDAVFVCKQNAGFFQLEPLIQSKPINISGTFIIENRQGLSSLTDSGDYAFIGFDSLQLGPTSKILYASPLLVPQNITGQTPYFCLELSSNHSNIDLSDSIIVLSKLNIKGVNLRLDKYRLALNGQLTLSGGSLEGTSLSSLLIMPDCDTLKLPHINRLKSLVHNGVKPLILQDDLIIDSFMQIGEGAVLFTDSFQLTGSGVVHLNGTLECRRSTGIHGTNATIPGMQVNIGPNSTVVFNRDGNQFIRARTDFANLHFSGSGEKSISKGFIPKGTVHISNNATLNLGNFNFGDSTTSLSMSGGNLFVGGSGTKPDIDGSYNLTGGSIRFLNNGLTRQRIKYGNALGERIHYPHIIISGKNHGLSNGDVYLDSNGLFQLDTGANITFTNRSIKSIASAGAILNGQIECFNEYGIQGLPRSCFDTSISLSFQNGLNAIYCSLADSQQIDPFIFNNLTLKNSSTKKISNDSLVVKGDFTQKGGTVYSKGQTHLLLQGGSQRIKLHSLNNAHIVVGGSGDKTLDSSFQLNGALEFESASLIMAGQQLELDSGVIINGGSPNAYFVMDDSATLRINHLDSLFIPVGGQYYCPLRIETDSSLSTEIRLCPQPYLNPINKTRALNKDVALFMWELLNPDKNANLQLTVFWTADSESPLFHRAACQLAYWHAGKSAKWEKDSLIAASGNSLYSVQRQIQLRLLDTFYFAVGSQNSPLPLSSITIRFSPAKSDLILAETNSFSNGYLSIEKSIDTRTWKEIKRGALNQKLLQIDKMIPDIRRQYFRAAYRNMDSKTITYSTLLSQPASMEKQLYWTCLNKVLRVRLLTENETLQLFDLSGRLIASTNKSADIPLQKGIYVMLFQTERILVYIPD